jgi:hypothetical protein
MIHFVHYWYRKAVLQPILSHLFHETFNDQTEIGAAGLKGFANASTECQFHLHRLFA